MKNTFNVLKAIVGIIAVLVFLAGVVLTIVGGYELTLVFSHLGSADKHHLAGVIGLGLLSAVDLFLIAIVFFVLALGIVLLFSDPANPFPVNLPEWLRIKTFMQLKVILWETILTTLVIGYLNMVAEKRLGDEEITLDTLIIPGGILLISGSLFLLKKNDKH